MEFSISDHCGLLRLTWTHVWSSPSPVSSSNYCTTTIYRVILALCVGKRLCPLFDLTKNIFSQIKKTLILLRNQNPNQNCINHFQWELTWKLENQNKLRNHFNWFICRNQSIFEWNLEWNLNCKRTLKYFDCTTVLTC